MEQLELRWLRPDGQIASECVFISATPELATMAMGEALEVRGWGSRYIARRRRAKQ